VLKCHLIPTSLSNKMVKNKKSGTQNPYLIIIVCWQCYSVVWASWNNLHWRFCIQLSTFFFEHWVSLDIYQSYSNINRNPLKGQCHEIFDHRFFSSNNTPWVPDSRSKTFLNSASNSPSYGRFSNAQIVQAVSMTPHAWKFFFGIPFKFICFLVVG
jgi:hypothetical protein